MKPTLSLILLSLVLLALPAGALAFSFVSQSSPQVEEAVDRYGYEGSMGSDSHVAGAFMMSSRYSWQHGRSAYGDGLGEEQIHATPEPGTMLLMGLGLAGGGLIARRNRRRS